MIPRGQNFLPIISAEKLRALARDEDNKKARLRLLAAAHRKEGQKLERIAETIGKPVTTIHDWLVRLHEDGMTRLRDVKQPGRTPRLNEKQRRTLVRELERGPPHNRNGLWSTKDVRELIRKKFGITYAPQHAWRLLVACGFSLLRPRKRHYKSASPGERLRFKKKRDAKLGTTERKDLLWARKMRPHSASSHSLRAAGRAKEAGPQ